MPNNKKNIIILDVGGDEVILLNGKQANEKEVARQLDRIMKQRADRFRTCTDAQKSLHDWWASGHIIFGRRYVSELDLTIYMAAAPLASLLAGEDEDNRPLLIKMAGTGMVFGTFYSAKEPEGEPGSVHIADIEQIKSQDFIKAKRQGWRQ